MASRSRRGRRLVEQPCSPASAKALPEQEKASVETEVAFQHLSGRENIHLPALQLIVERSLVGFFFKFRRCHESQGYYQLRSVTTTNLRWMRLKRFAKTRT